MNYDYSIVDPGRQGSWALVRGTGRNRGDDIAGDHAGVGLWVAGWNADVLVEGEAAGLGEEISAASTRLFRAAYRPCGLDPVASPITADGLLLTIDAILAAATRPTTSAVVVDTAVTV